MEKIRAQDLIELPITDAFHIAKEINWWRRYNEVFKAEQKRRSDYMQRYNERKKEL
jgi:hypothetical protein